MPVQAGRLQIIILRDLIAWFARSQAPVNLSPFDMLACTTTFSGHNTPYSTQQRHSSRGTGSDTFAPNHPVIRGHPGILMAG